MASPLVWKEWFEVFDPICRELSVPGHIMTMEAWKDLNKLLEEKYPRGARLIGSYAKYGPDSISYSGKEYGYNNAILAQVLTLLPLTMDRTCAVLFHDAAASVELFHHDKRLALPVDGVAQDLSYELTGDNGFRISGSMFCPPEDRARMLEKLRRLIED